MNLDLKNRLLVTEKKLLDISRSEIAPTPIIELKQMLLGEKRIEHKTFESFAANHVDTLKDQGRDGNAAFYLAATNRIIDFVSKPLKIESMDYSFILKFEQHLVETGVSVNGIAAYMRAVRALLNKAVKLDLMDARTYPFKHYSIRTERTPSRAESIENLRRFYKMELEPTSEQYHARNTFFLIFGLIGISFMDLITLRKKDRRGDRIIYRRKKTGKIYSIRITDFVQKLLDEYADSDSEFLLPQFGLDGIPESKVRLHVNLRLKTTNKYLKKSGLELGLETTLTTYVARYSWANIAKKLGFSKDLIAESLGHNYGNSVTGIYLDAYGDEVVDRANCEVLQSLQND